MRTHRALCISISAYSATCTGRLASPERDAAALTTKLRYLGFLVSRHSDPSNDELHVAVEKFIGTVKSGDTVLVYIASHGMQYGGDNYILPVEWQASRHGPGNALAVFTRIVDPLTTRSPRLSVILLDACRTQRESAYRADVQRGLTLPRLLPGVLMGFSCAPGKVARDGGDGLSPYVTALVKHLGVSVDVSKASWDELAALA